MARSVRLASRQSTRGFYDAATGQILIVAEGEAAAGDQVEIDEVVPPSTPLAFRLLAVRKPGIWPTVMRPYRVADFFRVAGDPDRVRVAGRVEVHHADGVDQVELQAMPAGLGADRSAQRPRSSTGWSASLSFDEAFGDAVAGLTRGDDTPDALLQVRVDEVGGMFGGFAGFHHLFVRIHAVGGAGGGGPIEEIAPERRTEGGVVVEVAPDRPISEVITEVAPDRPIVEIAPERPYSEVVVEVAPDRPESEGVVEIAPDRPEGDVITEIAPERPYGRPEGDVITEIAPERPYGEGITEVAPDRPEGDVITEIAPDRPEGDVITEIAPDRPEGDVITEVAPDRPEGDVITEVAPDRPGRPGSEVIAEIAPEKFETEPGAKLDDDDD
jgi:hypothetical protein